MTVTDAFWFFANLAIIHLRGAETEGKLAVVEMRAAPGDSPPLHVHHHEDEVFAVLEGRMTIQQPERIIDAPAGSFVLAERGVPHRYRVSEEGPARWLVLASPAGFEDFVAAIGQPARALELPEAPVAPEREELLAIAARYGIEIF